MLFTPWIVNIYSIDWKNKASTSKLVFTERSSENPRRDVMSDVSRVTLFNPEALFVPAAGYSQVAEVGGGKLVYIAGQVPFDKSGNLVGKDDFLAQTEQVFRNLKAAVEAAGGSFSDVVKLNYFAVEGVDSSLLPEVLKVRDRFVNTKTPPVSTFVFVKRLVRPEWLIEVEAVAVVNQ
jgi:enamine deaminase RidA (YjgF/YER057c/UK114 family)